MDKRLIESIEACRPGSDDIASPELADAARQIQQDPQVRSLYERVQKWDAVVAATIAQVSVPEGLADRILQRLRCESAISPVELHGSAGQPPTVEAAVQLAAVQLPAVQELDSRWSRRKWLAGLTTIAATILVAAFLSVWLPGDGDRPLEEVAEGWFQELSGNWQETQQPPGEFPLPGAITASPTSWQWLAKHSSARGVVYQLQDRAGTTALLYVVHLTRTGLPATPPTRPQSNTAGKAVGYWQSGDKVYVLVVPGDERSYRAFVSSSPVPLA
jgi:hypothetical protein